MAAASNHPTNLSGLLSFTVYQRGSQPRFWLCGVQERDTFTPSFWGGNTATSIELYRPFGAGSESDVFVSELSVSRQQQAMQMVHTFELRCYFLGAHAIVAVLQALNRSRATGLDDSWSGVFAGSDGQPMVLAIRFESGTLQQPYGESQAQIAPAAAAAQQ